MSDRGPWGFTDRPHPTMTGHVIATRQASGAQNVFRDAINRGSFIAAPPWSRIEDAKVSDDRLSLSRAYQPSAVNITIDEAAVLQGYPVDFTFAGNKGRQGLQVGNAVPPPLAKAILEALWS